MARRTTIRRRKDEHLSVCLKQDVGFQRKSTWLEHVHLVHQAVPAFSMEDVDVSLQFLGRRLSAPFLIGAMTGGTDAGARVNWGLAAAAARMGVGLALGSQRAMLEDPSMSGTFRVRDAAPDVLLLGNIGLSQVTVMETSGVVDLMTRIGADGMCVHLNGDGLWNLAGDGRAACQAGSAHDRCGWRRRHLVGPRREFPPRRGGRRCTSQGVRGVGDSDGRVSARGEEPEARRDRVGRASDRARSREGDCAGSDYGLGRAPGVAGVRPRRRGGSVRMD